MDGTPTSPPSAEEGLALHRRLLTGDPVGPADLALAYLDHLIAYLARRNPAVDRDLCEMAADDAVVALAKNPAAYDPGRSPLLSYLHMAAQGDLKNLMRREQRHRGRQVSLEAVEKSPAAGNKLYDERNDPARIAEDRERLAEALRAAPTPEGLTETETIVFQLMREGERRTSPYAAALRLGDLPFPEQQREVKRVKDRLKKRMERGGRR